MGFFKYMRGNVDECGRKRMGEGRGRGGMRVSEAFRCHGANLLRFHKTAMEVKPFHSFTSTIQQIHTLFTHGSITKWTVPLAIASIPGSPA